MPKQEPMNHELRELLDAVQRLPCSYSRKAMLRTLRGMAGRRLYITRRELVAPEELALALQLMGEMRMAEASKALQVRLECQKTKAYKLITAALQARQGHVPALHASADGMRQLGLALDDDGVD